MKSVKEPDCPGAPVLFEGAPPAPPVGRPKKSLLLNKSKSAPGAFPLLAMLGAFWLIGALIAPLPAFTVTKLPNVLACPAFPALPNSPEGFPPLPPAPMVNGIVELAVISTP